MNNQEQTINNHSDRYIPQREDMDIDMSNHVLTQNSPSNSTPPLYKKLEKSLYQEPKKILCFKQKAPVPVNQRNDNKILFSCSTNPKRSKKSSHQRHIATKPELTLEAPFLEDDFYSNVLDWSCNNILAVALRNEIFLWNGNDGSIEKIRAFADESSNVVSVRWSADGMHLAAGNDRNSVQLWDAGQTSLLRTMNGHQGRVSSLSWNKYVLSSGSKDASILNHDVRARSHVLSSFEYHSDEVCGLQWCPRGRTLASGGNDNLVALWDHRYIQQQNAKPRCLLTSHKAAVKAISWAPFQADLLATGGGTGDRCIRFWNTQTGIELNCIDTGSQICALQWAKNESRELISSHGYAKNQLMVWKYPSLKQVAGDLIGHTRRVLHMTQSPDGTTVATAASDEKLCFWKVFEQKKRKQKTTRRLSNNVSRAIR